MNTDLLQNKAAQQATLRFGRYQTVRLLGKGAMGMVYLAHDPVLDRAIALKVISVDPNLDKKTKEDYFQRFSYEAKASAKLNHPSIVPVYDAGEDNGMPWIAFQFIEGETLEKMLKRRDRLPIKRAMAFALDIAEALKHAHGCAIIHRDVKPANILIESLSGIAKLTDFGIVKAPWAPATQAGSTLGSPGYMSPEQIEGSELDQRADIFCLGVVLYQMITGKHPFLRDTMASTAFATCSGAFAPMRNMVDGIDSKLEWAVRSCLAADKKKRIESAQKLIDILNSIPVEPKAGMVKNPLATAKAALGSTLSRHGVIPRFFESILWSGKAIVSFCMHSPHRIGRAITRPTSVKHSPVAITHWLSGIVGGAAQRFYKRSPASATWSIVGAVLLIGTLLAVGIFGNRAASPSPDSPEAALISQCQTGLSDNNRDLAVSSAVKLSALNPRFPIAHIIIARTCIHDGKFEAAAKAIAMAVACKGGRRVLKRELPALLDDVSGQLKKTVASTGLIDLIIYSLHAGRHPQIRTWSTDTNYWLRWNSVKILKAASVEVDTVPVYILDLAFAGSVQTRLQAVRMLGQLSDKRAMSALRKVKELGQNDPLVSAEASRVLEENSR